MNRLIKWSFEEQKCIEMIYQNEKGTITQRIIKVKEMQENYVRAYCYLRKQERLFKMTNILSVATIQKRGKRGA